MSISLDDFTNLLLTIETSIKSSQEERNKLQEKIKILDEDLSYMRGAHRYLKSVGPKGIKYGENTFTYSMTNKLGEYKQGNIMLKEQSEGEDVGDVVIDRE